jgi:UDP-GlcNAc:undecaprenyl-phosphate GlcNAc-1-phosphate transferase
MLELAIGCVTSAALALVLTPMVRAAALRYGLVDRPDGARKIHAKATPSGGGIAILLSMLLTVGLMLVYPTTLREYLLRDWSVLVGLGIAGVLICALGVADDYWRIRGRYKLLAQTVIVSLVIALGVRISSFNLFGLPVELGWFAVPFTVFFLLGAINSLNLLDGMDGFLCAIGGIATLGFASMACLNGSWTAACVAFILAGALLGFLRYNFPPASIFLGDSGSTLIGLTIGILAIQSSLKTPATISLAAPLAIMTLPILDTFAAIVRRKLTGRSIYATDRGHLHHCLASRGLSNRDALVCVALLSSVAVVGALASQWLRSEFIALLAILTVVCILIATRLFGYAELMLIKKSLAHKTTQFLSFGRTRPQELELRWQGKIDWRRHFNQLQQAAQELQVRRLTLEVDAPAFGEGYHARWEHPAAGAPERDVSWTVGLPICLGGQVVGRLELAGERRDELFWEALAKIAVLVEEFELQLTEALSADAARPPLASAPEMAASTAG